MIGNDRDRPVERVAEAGDRWGDSEVVRRSAALLRITPNEPVTGELLDLAVVLGGLRDREWLAGGKPPGNAYWARVWAARALRYVWRDSASAAIVHALGDEHWRVREMSAKVVGDREVADSAERLATLLEDDVPRVRKAAVLALAVVAEGEHADSIRTLLDDADESVADAAAKALAAMSERLDRRF